MLERFFIFERPSAKWIVFGNILFLMTLLSPLFLFCFYKQDCNLGMMWKYKLVFIKGWMTTIYISASSFLLSTLIGVLCAFAKRSSLAPLRYLTTLYVETIRGTPLLVQILFFFYILGDGIGIHNRYIVGIFALSFFSAAYLAEIFRAGIESVSASQIESAKAIGLTKIQAYRFIILPQAFRVTLPPLSGQFASLIKDSSLLSIIGISELTYNAQQVNSTTYSTLESFLPLAAGYILLTLPISLWSKCLEKKYLYET